MPHNTSSRRMQSQRAVEQNVQGLLAFLRQYPPFDAMEQRHVLDLLAHSRLVFFAAGDVVINPADGAVAHWYVVRQGVITGRRESSADARSEAAEIAVDMLAGDGFPYAAIMAERPSRRIYTAEQDSFCLQLPVADFVRLLEASEPLRQFALQGLGGLLGRISLQTQAQAAQTFSGADLLATPLRQLLRQPLVACTANTPVREAVHVMEQQHSTSIGVVNEAGGLVGIFTLRDLRALVAHPQGDLEAEIATVMVHAPHALRPDDTAFDATMLMTKHHFGHVCVVDSGQFLGIVSERHLLELQRVDVVQLARLLCRAPSVDALAAVRGRIAPLVSDMQVQGASAEQVLRVVTQLNDHTVERVIELMLREHGDPGIPFGWIAFGSEARGEQTLLTDQDNGIIFQAENEEQANAYQARLLPLAKAINQALDVCGLSWCKGNIMASNPDWCLADFQWSAWIERIVRNGSPQDLLDAVVLLDACLLWGADAGFTSMRARALALLQHDTAFQRLMAVLALERSPAAFNQLSQWAHKLSQVLGKEEPRLDLKTQALALFVDAVRILALAHGVNVASTVERLRKLVQQGHLSRERGQAYEQAFNYLQQLRLSHHQTQWQAGQALDNGLQISTLNTLDQRVLRGALQEAERLQQHLHVRYQV